jgi:hypothetical protein
MANNLTGSTIASTYSQLLHVNGGPTATEKTVYSGTGVATAFRVGTTSASVGNVQFSGSTVQAISGDLILGSDIAFASQTNARTALGLGTMATQAANNVAITGGAISNVTFTGSFVGITLIESDKFSTKNGGDGVSLESNNIFAEGPSTNLDLNIAAKGTGEVNVTNIDVLSGKVPFNTITNRAYASFYDAGTTDQTGSTTDRTAVKWATAAVTGAGITVASNSRLTFAAAGTYRVNASLQFFNSDNTVRTVDIWFAKNGTNIANSGARITVPANNAGGTYLAAYEIFETVAANDYVEMYWYPSNVSAKLQYIAPVAANPGVTPAIPAVPPAIVVVERIA